MLVPASLVSCGGGGKGPDAKHSIEDIVVIGGQLISANGAPDPSPPDVAPVVQAPTTVDTPKATKVTIPLSVDVNGVLKRIFLKTLTGAVQIETASSSAKAQSTFNVELATDDDFATGQFCFDVIVTDDDDLSSEPQQVCLNVQQPATPNRQPELHQPPSGGSGGGGGGGVGDGGPRVVHPGEVVALAKIGDDPDGDALSFQWRQISGLPVTLDNANTENASFIVPGFSSDTLLTFQVVVTDSHGAITDDLISVAVVVDNHAPLVDAGADQTAQSGETVNLSSAVSDQDGDALTLNWTQVAGSVQVGLTAPDTLTPSFVAPTVTSPTTIVLRLTATDPSGAASDDTVLITVNP